VIRDDTRLRIISVFNPPLVGNQTHDADGAYPPAGQIPPGQERMLVRTLEDVCRAGRVVETGGFATSERYLTVADGLGFSFHSVRIRKGREGDLWYKHDWEGDPALEGTLEVADRGTGGNTRMSSALARSTPVRIRRWARRPAQMIPFQGSASAISSSVTFAPPVGKATYCLPPAR
jgi:hypothetical protein